jgi:hypothetical protein
MVDRWVWRRQPWAVSGPASLSLGSEERGSVAAGPGGVPDPGKAKESAVAHDVFISYSHHDKPQADAVCATLEATGIRCWIAPRDVIPGQEWGAAIVDAIRSSRVMVLMFSSHANDSPQIRREVQLAVDAETVLIPFRIEDVLPQRSLAYFLGAPHWLDALTPPLEAHLERLAAAVASFLAVAEAPGLPAIHVRPSAPAAAAVADTAATAPPNDPAAPTGSIKDGESLLRELAATGQWETFDELIADLSFVKTVNTTGWSVLFPQLVQSAPVTERDHLRTLPTIFVNMGWTLAKAGENGDAVFMFYRALEAIVGLVNRDPSTTPWLSQLLADWTDTPPDLCEFLYNRTIALGDEEVAHRAGLAYMRLGQAINLVERAGLAVPQRAAEWRDGMRQRSSHLS